MTIHAGEAAGLTLFYMEGETQKRPYDIYDVIGRLFDGSEFAEYKNGYGPEVVTGLAKVNGLLVGVVANVQGLLMNYPEYKQNSVGIGGKLYRQGLIKMNEFVTLCARDRIPLIWLQDTTGIDVGDDAEKAELLGLGQSLIYSIQNSKLPSLEVTLRKASAAAHYVLGGPQGNDTNVFSLATGASEYYVMPGETAANAMYSRKLVKVQGLLMNYPEYKQNSVGIGGKLYRQGLIKMNEFVTLCARDRIPLIWLQDTTGIDVGDDAEKAELLGLGQSLIYSIQNSKLPSLEVTRAYTAR